MIDAISVQCRGAEGKLAKDVGVVIVKSDIYQNCGVNISCPHYIGHPTKSESTPHDSNYGGCKVCRTRGFGRNKFFRSCLYDRINL